MLIFSPSSYALLLESRPKSLESCKVLQGLASAQLSSFVLLLCWSFSAIGFSFPSPQSRNIYQILEHTVFLPYLAISWSLRCFNPLSLAFYLSCTSRSFLSLKKEGHPIICDNMDESWEHHAKWNKPAGERQILHDSTYKRYLESSNPRQKLERWLPGAGIKGRRGVAVKCL